MIIVMTGMSIFDDADDIDDANGCNQYLVQYYDDFDYMIINMTMVTIAMMVTVATWSDDTDSDYYYDRDDNDGYNSVHDSGWW